MGWIQAGFGQDSGGKRVLLRDLCARNDFETTAKPSRIEGNTDKRETFNVWEVKRIFLVRSQGAAICVHAQRRRRDMRPLFLLVALVALERAYSCFTCKHIKHSYVAHPQHTERAHR